MPETNIILYVIILQFKKDFKVLPKLSSPGIPSKSSGQWILNDFLQTLISIP